MKEQYTREEVIQLLVDERKRAVDIAYEFKNKHDKAHKSKEKAGNDLAFIQQEIADTCRLVGNAISGGNALTATLGETMEDRIIKELDKNT